MKLFFNSIQYNIFTSGTHRTSDSCIKANRKDKPAKWLLTRKSKIHNLSDFSWKTWRIHRVAASLSAPGSSVFSSRFDQLDQCAEAGNWGLNRKVLLLAHSCYLQSGAAQTHLQGRHPKTGKSSYFSSNKCWKLLTRDVDLISSDVYDCTSSLTLRLLTWSEAYHCAARRWGIVVFICYYNLASIF